MAIIKCKMCGGDLTLDVGRTVAACEYCGTVQTVPTADSERKLNLFARANRLRAACDFDKAAAVYTSITADFPEDAEAYWGLVLCRYGIEYVDDPATGKKIPTCHRTSFQSLLEDSDFEMVLENADVISRPVYREEARFIEELRKNILAVSSCEEPYDIFICYKETDFSGNRTLDSVLAQDIYDALTQKNYRVFFSRITLEDKLGQEYEPYIFAALHSAKIMLAVGTDYEYFNAVWVKNEWSRYLKLMERDKSRHLIPCYKGIDAYDMPQEFGRLQGQDLGKLGAIQDLLRGIDKLMPRQNVTVPVVQGIMPMGGVSVSNLLKRVEMALEDEKWSAADDFCEQILNIDAQNGEALLYKIMAAARISSRSAIEADPALLLDSHAVTDRDMARVRRYAGSELTQWLVRVDHNWAQILETRRQAEEARHRQEEERRKRQEAEQRRKAEEAEWEQQRIARQMEAQKAAMLIIHQLHNRLSAGYAWGHSACVRWDGTVSVSHKPKHKIYKATEWQDVCAVAVGPFHIVGLRRDGSLLAIPGDYKTNVTGWRDVAAICTSNTHTVALLKNGAVRITGYDLREAEQWRDMADVRVGNEYVVGLLKNGTAVAMGKNKNGQCNVRSWQNLCAISVGTEHTVGLRNDGTAVAAGQSIWGQCDVSSWNNLVAVSAGVDHTLGLRSDGTVCVAGNTKNGISEVLTWRNIVAISAGYECCLGLQADGTVRTAGKSKMNRGLLEGINLFSTMPPEERETFMQTIVNARSMALKYVRRNTP